MVPLHFKFHELTSSQNVDVPRVSIPLQLYVFHLIELLFRLLDQHPALYPWMDTRGCARLVSVL